MLVHVEVRARGGGCKGAPRKVRWPGVEVAGRAAVSRAAKPRLASGLNVVWRAEAAKGRATAIEVSAACACRVRPNTWSCPLSWLPSLRSAGHGAVGGHQLPLGPQGRGRQRACDEQGASAPCKHCPQNDGWCGVGRVMASLTAPLRVRPNARRPQDCT